MSDGKFPVPDSFTDGCDEGKDEHGDHTELKEKAKKGRLTRGNE